MSPDDKASLAALGMIVLICFLTAYMVWQVAR